MHGFNAGRLLPVNDNDGWVAKVGWRIAGHPIHATVSDWGLGIAEKERDDKRS